MTVYLKPGVYITHVDECRMSQIVKSIEMREIINDDFLLQFSLHYFDDGHAAIGCQGFRRKQSLDNNKNQQIGMIETPLIMIGNHPVMMIRCKEYIGSGGRDIWSAAIREAFDLILDDIGIDTRNCYSYSAIKPVQIPFEGMMPEYMDKSDYTYDLIRFNDEADRVAFLMFGKNRCIDYNDTFTLPETFISGEPLCK